MFPIGVRRLFRGAQDQRGIALPMALFGLVAISLLVTTALLTSTTEWSIASAQTDAAREMYQTEGALQAYVAGRGSNLAVTQTTYTVPGTTTQYSIDVARMSVYKDATSNDGMATYAIRGERATGGRSLIAMLRVPVKYLDVRVNAGASFGTDATISGSIDVNSSSNLCSLAGADDAVTHAQGTTLTIKGQAKTNIGNDTSTFEGDRFAMRDTIMNGIDLNQLARAATIRFRQASSNADSVFDGRPNWNHVSKNYRWGCPNRMTDCSGADTTYYPMVVIDAATASGGMGEVRIQGDHGQGMLIILRGNLRITGNFVYKGIILVEGATDIHGGGGNGSKIEGALVGLGTVNICNIDSENCQSNAVSEGSDLSSGAVIQYNRCAINSVQQFLNKQPVQQAVRRPTFAWFEAVR